MSIHSSPRGGGGGGRSRSRRGSDFSRGLLPLVRVAWWAGIARAAAAGGSAAFSPPARAPGCLPLRCRSAAATSDLGFGAPVRQGRAASASAASLAATDAHARCDAASGGVAGAGAVAVVDGSRFWGEPRTEGEIVDFVVRAVFDEEAEGWNRRGDERRKRVEVLRAEPPLLLIHGFLDDDMCEDIVRTARETGEMKRSTTGATQDTTNIRTSSTVWLQENQCEGPARTFAHRVSRLSGVPPGHMENLQVVHYEPGQKFDLHTDHLDSFNDLECRGRLATCLLYLNSAEPNPEEEVRFDRPKAGLTGGETWFPEFDVRVRPERGSVVFWFNTVQRPGSDGFRIDMFLNVDAKMRHAGLPVLSGEKWVANRWIHPIDIGTGVRGLD